MPSQKFTTSFNPATGDTIGRTPLNNIAELERAVALAKVAQSEWAALSFSERAKHLFFIRDYIVDNVDRIADIISKDSGKTKMDALSTEILPTAMAITYYATHASKVLKRKRLHGGSILTINKRSYVDRGPSWCCGNYKSLELSVCDSFSRNRNGSDRGQWSCSQSRNTDSRSRQSHQRVCGSRRITRESVSSY